MRSLGTSTEQQNSQDISDKKRERFEWGALKTLLPYLWPPGDMSIRTRVVLALLFLALAKLANVYVPF